jgi:hypothetical protein
MSPKSMLFLLPLKPRGYWLEQQAGPTYVEWECDCFLLCMASELGGSASLAHGSLCFFHRGYKLD